MVGIGNVMPSLSGVVKGNLHSVLDLVFRDNALILSDSQVLVPALGSLATRLGGSMPLPLVGFTFETPSDLTFMKYSYSEFPYLNKATVANSFVKETSSTTIRALRPIFGGNGVVTNYGLNKTLVTLIESYADKGGTFAINTMWGYYGNFALEELKGYEVSGVGGIGFEFHLKRINFDALQSAGGIVSNLLNKLMS